MPEPGTTDLGLIVTAAGLAVEDFVVRAWAPPVADKPGLLSGTLTGPDTDGVFAVIRAWEQEDYGWIAAATVSRNPQLAIGGMSDEEQERLRAERLTPQGASEPVGQEEVVGRSEAVPYTPPLPTPDPEPGDVHPDATPPTLDGEIVAEITVTELPCGPECVMLDGPEGRVFEHKPPCAEA